MNPVLSAHGQGASTPSGAEGDTTTDQLMALLGSTVETTQKAVSAMGNYIQNIDYYNGLGSGSGNEDDTNATGLKRIGQIVGQVLMYNNKGGLNVAGTVKNLMNAFANGDLDDLPGVVSQITNAINGKDVDWDLLLGKSIGQINNVREKNASGAKVQSSAKSYSVSDDIKKKLNSAMKSGDASTLEKIMKTYYGSFPLGKMLVLITDIANARKEKIQQERQAALVNSISSINRSGDYRDTKKK